MLALHRKLTELIDHHDVEACVELAKRHLAENGRYTYWKGRENLVDVSHLPFTSRNSAELSP